MFAGMQTPRSHLGLTMSRGSGAREDGRGIEKREKEKREKEKREKEKREKEKREKEKREKDQPTKNCEASRAVAAGAGRGQCTEHRRRRDHRARMNRRGKSRGILAMRSNEAEAMQW